MGEKTKSKVLPLECCRRHLSFRYNQTEPAGEASVSPLGEVAGARYPSAERLRGPGCRGKVSRHVCCPSSPGTLSRWAAAGAWLPAAETPALAQLSRVGTAGGMPAPAPRPPCSPPPAWLLPHWGRRVSLQLRTFLTPVQGRAPSCSWQTVEPPLPAPHAPSVLCPGAGAGAAGISRKCSFSSGGKEGSPCSQKCAVLAARLGF